MSKVGYSQFYPFFFIFGHKIDPNIVDYGAIDILLGKTFLEHLIMLQVVY